MLDSFLTPSFQETISGGNVGGEEEEEEGICDELSEESPPEGLYNNCCPRVSVWFACSRLAAWPYHGTGWPPKMAEQ